VRGKPAWTPASTMAAKSGLAPGLCYIRGNALDYDGWAQLPGLSGWSYDQCLPYFRKAVEVGGAREAGLDPGLHHGGKERVGAGLRRRHAQIRGNALDYDGWAQLPGLSGWSYDQCLPYFRKAESLPRPHSIRRPFMWGSGSVR
jgi:choline dehydrogenase-like flavoprotein